MQPHHHVVCDACGSVRDIPPTPRDAAVPSARRLISRAAPGFEVRSVEQIFRGLCGACGRHSSPKSSQEASRGRQLSRSGYRPFRRGQSEID
jgi:Fur family peroxide stress response transcriptional regulator